MKETVTIRIDKDLNILLQYVAERYKGTVDEMVEEAVREYYEDESQSLLKTEPQESEGE